MVHGKVTVPHSFQFVDKKDLTHDGQTFIEHLCYEIKICEHNFLQVRAENDLPSPRAPFPFSPRPFPSDLPFPFSPFPSPLSLLPWLLPSPRALSLLPAPFSLFPCPFPFPYPFPVPLPFPFSPRPFPSPLPFPFFPALFPVP